MTTDPVLPLSAEEEERLRKAIHDPRWPRAGQKAAKEWIVGLLATLDEARATPVAPEGPSTCPACGGNLDHPWWTVGDDSYDCAPVAPEDSLPLRHGGRAQRPSVEVAQDSPDPLTILRDARAAIARHCPEGPGTDGLLADIDAAIEEVSRDH
jgi:hypothetical protein